MLDHQDKYMMKAQVHVSKSFAISDELPLPQRKHYCQIYQVVKHMLRGTLLASFLDREHEGDDTRSQGGIKDNDLKIKIQDHSMQMISQIISQEQGSKIPKKSPLKPSSKKAPMIPKLFKECKYYGFNDHHSDHYSGYSRHMTGIKQYLHRYSNESGSKVVFGDDSLGDTEGKIENFNKVRVKELRSDNETEFRNHKLEEFYDEKGISQNFSSLCTPKQNFVAEKRNRTLIHHYKRHGKTSYNMFRGRSPDISYFHVFGCPVHIHNHMDHLEKFDEKADDGFFLGCSSIAKALRVFKIRRQEMEEIVHVTFSKDDEAISHSSTEGDAIYFNENKSFPDDEFLKPKSKVTNDVQPSPTIPPSAEVILQTHVPQDRSSREKHIELVNIIGEPLVGITTRSKIRDSDAALASECLYVNFLSKLEPKKLNKALKEEWWIVAMQDELNHSERNKF
uniref:Retrovirus-related Pol polyprotein from transposon TNT 1-94 n=1 Tax=Tanacetum cinerariifolium TaxID=118510 RepID=A0A6L2NTJ5_TANCI|nr:retrovirus-related Pol polyprotein from transposon TNT 1-94 [Tanacetum cinerariifolium]